MLKIHQHPTGKQRKIMICVQLKLYGSIWYQVSVSDSRIIFLRNKPVKYFQQTEFSTEGATKAKLPLAGQAGQASQLMWNHVGIDHERKESKASSDESAITTSYKPCK